MTHPTTRLSHAQALLAICSLVNVLVRQYCYPTEVLKRNRGCAKSMLGIFGCCAGLCSAAVWGSLIHQHVSVTRSADFCFDFDKSMRAAIHYKYPRETFMDNGAPIGDRYLNYYMMCDQTQEASLFTERYVLFSLFSLSPHAFAVI